MDALPDSAVSRTDEVVSSLPALHPAPHADERAGMGSLSRVASRVAPVAEVDQVRKAVRSFPSTSGAGCSGLRPSHIRDAKAGLV